MTNHRLFTRATMLLTALTVSLAVSTPAWAALETKEEAYEVRIDQIQRWPLRAGDSLVVRPCRGCDLQTLRVTAETRYATGLDENSETMTLSETLRKKSRIRNDANHLILVFYRPDDHQVTRLILRTDF